MATEGIGAAKDQARHMKGNPHGRAAVYGRRMPGRVAMLVLSLSLSCTVSSDVPARSERVPQLWVISGGWFDQLRFHDRDLAKRFFLQPPSIIVGTYHLRFGKVGAPAPKQFRTAFAWASLEAFEDVARTPFVRKLDAAMYDPEAWPATPLVEQRDLTRSFARFASVARRYVDTVILTPHPNLMEVEGARCHAEGNESVYEAFLRCRVMDTAARSADIVEVQAQQLQHRPHDYRAFVAEATAQARAARDDVKVIVGLTTVNASAGQLRDAWESVRDIVDGYYLSIRDRNDVTTAIDFLGRLPVATAPTDAALT
jgi:hypothetical protein